MNRTDRSDGRGMRTAGLALLVAVATLAAAACAHAATYHAFLCRIPYGPSAGKPAPADGTTYLNEGVFTSAFQNCAGGGAMTATMDGSTTHPFGDNSTVTFTPPAGTTVAGFALWRQMAVGPTQPFGAPVTNIYYTGVIALGEGLCAQSLGCSGRGNATAPLAAENAVGVADLSGVTEVRWDARCGGGPGGTCPASGAGTLSAITNVYAADMLLNDGAPPAVTSVAGPLLAGGRLAGAQSVSVNATDAASGVRGGTLVIDGTPAPESVFDANGGACADLAVAPDGRPSYVRTQPCPAAVSGLLTLNTDALAPGAHTLTILVSDAAGNQTIASTGTIDVVGSLPAGTPNGAGASRAAKLTATFTSNRRHTRRLGFRSRARISGRLVDEARNPIAGAAVEILARERRTGAHSAAIATAQTGADGRFRFELPSGPARRITVQYRAFSGDPKPATGVKLSALVGARVTASIAPRSVRAGRLVHVTGRLTYLRRGGVDVQIQTRQGRIWRTADTVRTRADGRFRWPYRFRPNQAGHRFVLRVRVASAIYPFVAGASNTFAVRVSR